MFDAAFLLRVLFSALITASGFSWLRWGLRPEQFGGPSRTLPDETSSSSQASTDEKGIAEEQVVPTPWPPVAIFAVLFWVTTMLLAQIVEDSAPLWKSVETTPAAADTEPKTETGNPPGTVRSVNTTTAIWGSMVLGCSVFIGVGCLLFLTGQLRPEDVGIQSDQWPAQLAWGQQAFLASIAPTIVLILATAWLRSRETQHPFLQMLTNQPDQVPLLMMFFVAAIVAPLSEELVFRVTLQGWLTERWHARGAIITTALIFSFVHGWRDGLALIPLSLILGYLYHVRRSYLAVVTTHSLFNATNMALALLSAMGSSDASG